MGIVAGSTLLRTEFVFHDPSFAYGNRIERLISEIHREEETHAQED